MCLKIWFVENLKNKKRLLTVLMNYDNINILMSSVAVFVGLVVGLFFKSFVVILCIQCISCFLCWSWREPFPVL